MVQSPNDDSLVVFIGKKLLTGGLLKEVSLLFNLGMIVSPTRIILQFIILIIHLSFLNRHVPIKVCNIAAHMLLIE